jgi:hypothetical protein
MLWDYLISNIKIGGSGLSLLEPAQEEPDIGTSLLLNPDPKFKPWKKNLWKEEQVL